MKYLSVFLFASFIIFSACGPKQDFTQEIKTTDSLKQELQASAKEFSKLDSVQIKQVRKSIDAYLGFITNNIKDTVERNDALLLSHFKSVNKNLGKYMRTHAEINRNYKHNVKQLDDLAYDLSNRNIGSSDSAKKYVLSEKEANEKLIAAMKLHTRVVPVELKKYDSLKVEVETFIKKINNGTVPPDLLQPEINK